MHCIILFRDAAGWLPTAQELRRCGFGVSEAVLPAASAREMGARPMDARPMDAPGRQEYALAAEPKAVYGGAPREANGSPDPLGPGEPDVPVWSGA